MDKTLFWVIFLITKRMKQFPPFISPNWLSYKFLYPEDVSACNTKYSLVWLRTWNLLTFSGWASAFGLAGHSGLPHFACPANCFTICFNGDNETSPSTILNLSSSLFPSDLNLWVLLSCYIEILDIFSLDRWSSSKEHASGFQVPSAHDWLFLFVCSIRVNNLLVSSFLK